MKNNIREMMDKVKNFNPNIADKESHPDDFYIIKNFEQSRPDDFYIIKNFESMKTAMYFAETLGEIESINEFDNNSGYGYLRTEQYIVKYKNNTYAKVGGTFSVSKAKTLYFVKTYDENKQHFDNGRVTTF